MATSSITKEFVVKNEKAFFQIIEEIGNKPERTEKTVDSSNIERGRKLLRQFSFR